MRSTVLILISILIVVAGTLAFISSNADYLAEKLFYQAMKVSRKIALNPDVAPPAMVSSVERNLRKVVERYPKAKITKAAYLSLVEFYLNNKEYEQARACADEIIAEYSADRIALSKAYFLKGVTFEKQERWAEALPQYRIVRDEYTDTLLGLGIPIYIGEYYKERQEYPEAETAYNEAVLFYRQLEKENREKPLGYAAANLLMSVYLRLEQYEEAAKVLEDTLNNYPKVQIFAPQLQNIEEIFIKKLNKPEKALQLYTSIRDRTDNKRLLEFIDGRIQALNVQKTGQ